MFRTVPLSIFRSLALYTQQWYMSYRLCWLLASKQSAYSWWWTEILSETCRFFFFYVLLTVHLNIFILILTNLMH